MILFDADLQSEALCRPFDRKPPFDHDGHKRLMSGIMQGRGAQMNEYGQCCRPVSGDVHFVGNGGRLDLADMRAPFTEGGKTKTRATAPPKTVTVILSEESLRNRKERI